MHSNSKSGNRVEVDPCNISRSTLCSEPWWHSTGHNPISPVSMQGNSSDSSSVEQSADGMSQSNGVQNEGDENATKESQNTAPLGIFQIIAMIFMTSLFHKCST